MEKTAWVSAHVTLAFKSKLASQATCLDEEGFLWHLAGQLDSLGGTVNWVKVSGTFFSPLRKTGLFGLFHPRLHSNGRPAPLQKNILTKRFFAHADKESLLSLNAGFIF